VEDLSPLWLTRLDAATLAFNFGTARQIEAAGGPKRRQAGALQSALQSFDSSPASVVVNRLGRV